jgi:type I restriction enzyme R subunit
VTNSINNLPQKQKMDDASSLEEHFDGDEYRILVVANKFLTGFDQPKLTTMYVDKKLQGVLAVQALSRLNRCNAKLGKRTEDMFVLDFFNNTGDIKLAFDPFYTQTSLSGATDYNMLHDVKADLDDVGVYDWHEVEQFYTLYINNVDAEKLSPIIDVCAERFKHELELSEEAKVDFKIKAKQFVKVYAQLACILDFENADWEMLYWFLKFLIPKLPIQDKTKDAIDGLLNSVDLSTYGLQRTKLNCSIELDSSESEIDPQNPDVRGVHGSDDDESPLDEIIRIFNERFFAGWDATPEEQKVKLLNIAKSVAKNPSYRAQVLANSDQQNRQLALAKLIKEAINQERRKEIGLYKMYANDADFKRAIEATIARVLAAADVDEVLQAEFGLALND